MALLFTAPLFYPSSSSSSASASVAHPSSEEDTELVPGGGVEQGPLHPSDENIVKFHVTSKETELFQHYHLLGHNFNNNHPKPSVGHTILAPLVPKSRGALIVKASSDVDGTESSAPDSPIPKDTNENVPVENLPLESKIKMHLEQKMKMKIAKKIRLRRKRLLRKRHLRKKGRWPPSKLKKNKNV